MESDGISLPDGMRLLEASSDTWSLFRDIRREAMETDPQAFGPRFREDAEGDERHWKRRLKAPERRLFGVLSGDKLVATAGMKALEDDLWLIFGMYVAPDRRKKGLSTALLRFMIEEARKKSVSTLILTVHTMQKPAIALYRGLGFDILERKGGQIAADGSVQTELLMALRL